MTIRRNEVLSDLSIKTPRDKLETIIITDIYIYLILLILFKSCFTQGILSYSFSSFNSFQLLPTTDSISYSFSLSNTDSHVHTPPHMYTRMCMPTQAHKVPPKGTGLFCVNQLLLTMRPTLVCLTYPVSALGNQNFLSPENSQ